MRDQSIRKSARSSTAVPVWTTVQQEKRSSGPRCTCSPSVRGGTLEPPSRGSQHFPVGIPAVTAAATRATGIWWLPTCSNHQSCTAGFARCGASRDPASTSIKRPCPTARRRGCPWSGAVTTSPWLLEASDSSNGRPAPVALFEGRRSSWRTIASIAVAAPSRLALGRHSASSRRATSTPTRRSLLRRVARRRRVADDAPGDRSQTRGAVLREGAVLPRLSACSSLGDTGEAAALVLACAGTAPAS